jgi:hypothetical protein
LFGSCRASYPRRDPRDPPKAASAASVGAAATGTPVLKADTVQFASMVAGIAAAVAGRDINLASAAGGNAAANNFLNHTQAALLKKDLGACAAKPAGCSTQETDAIFNQYRKLSSQNIDQVQACKFTGNAQCVSDLEANAAKPGEVTGTALSAQQEGWLYARQSDVQSYASVNGNSGPGNTDVQQAQQIARFRQANCADPGSAACDAVVTQAMRSAQTGALKLVGGALLAGPVSALASLTPAAVGAVGVALRACAADPLLCASTASIVGADAATMGATGTGALGATIGAAKVATALEQAAADAAAVARAAQLDAKVTSQIIAQYGPLNQGPLPTAVANTFRSATYADVITTEPTVLYRVYGGTADELGGYWTRTPPTGPVQSIVDSALSPQWGNTAVNVAKIEVPAGTRFFEGAAAQQGGLVGGGNQVLFPKGSTIDPSWKVEP